MGSLFIIFLKDIALYSNYARKMHCTNSILEFHCTSYSQGKKQYRVRRCVIRCDIQLRLMDFIADLIYKNKQHIFYGSFDV